MSRPVAVPWAPIPAANPPAKSWAAASENGPSGSIVNVATSAGAIDSSRHELDISGCGRRRQAPYAR